MEDQPQITTGGPHGWSRALRVGAIVAAGSLLLLTLLDFPTVPFDIDHDLSSSASLEYYAAHGVQFGTQLVQNVGPLGWVHYSSVYAGYMQNPKLVLGLLQAIALCVLVLWACTRFESRVVRAAWLLGFVLLIPMYPIGESSEVDFLVGEVWVYLAVYLSGLALLSLPPGSRLPRLAVAPIVFLAFLSLVKHTLLLVSGFVIFAVTLQYLARREVRRALLVALLYAASVGGIWLLAGQRPGNLLAYGLGVFRFTSGYNEAMGWPASGLSTGLAVVVLAGFAGVIAWRSVRRTQSLAKSAIDAIFVFIVWKHGFVRGDPQHVAIFFHTCALLAWLVALAAEHPGGETRGSPLRAPLSWATAGLVVMCSLALFSTIADAQYRPASLIALWQRNLAWLGAPSRKSADLAAQLEAIKARFHLPKMQARVGGARVDFFGYKPGWLLLNDLNYAPRPMPISFAATNEFLLRRNEAFYRDPRVAPRFVLCELMTIDNRLVSADDSLALGAILDNYHPLQFGVPRITTAREEARRSADTGARGAEVSGDLLLLMERNAPEHMQEHAERTLLETKEIGFDEPLAIADVPNGWIWLEADVRSSLLGQLRSLLLRPAALEIVVEVEGRPDPLVRRYVASMGKAGFLISPLIENSQDLFDAYSTEPTAKPLARVRSVRFRHAPNDGALFEPRIATRLYGGHGPGPQIGAE